MRSSSRLCTTLPIMPATAGDQISLHIQRESISPIQFAKFLGIHRNITLPKSAVC